MKKRYAWSKVTAIIKTFLRDEYFFECVRSLREAYPKIKIVVADDGYCDARKKAFVEEYCDDYVRMPFDVGLPAGRNLLVEKYAKTPYVLIGDDDFLYTKDTNLEALYDLMDVCDLAGGRVKEKGKLRNYQGFIEFQGDHLNYTKLTDKDPADMPQEFWDKTKTGTRYKHCDLTFNFAIMKREIFKKALWDENIYVAYEHSDFFISVKNAGFKTAFTPDACVIHKPEHVQIKNIAEYKTYRSRKSDKKYFFNKWKIKTASDMNNNPDVAPLDDGTEVMIKSAVEPQNIAYCITTFERFDKLKELLFSIAKHQPRAKVYIADDSKKFYVDDYKKLWVDLAQAGLHVKPKAFNVKYDAGLSFKRNFLYENTTEPFLLFLEDDFVFTEDTDIEKLLRLNSAIVDAGIVGGGVKNKAGELMQFHGHIEKKGDAIIISKQKDDYQTILDTRAMKTDIIPNFLLVKRAALDSVQWDPEIKIHGEHSDFFLRFKDTTWGVWYVPDITVAHHHDKTDGYEEMRRRTEFFALMLRKHRVKKLITYKVAQEPNGAGGIKTYRIC